MQTIFIFINTFIFIVLGAIHLYWGFGGKKFAEGAIPSQTNGTLLFRPGIVATLIVAFGLFGFATLTWSATGAFSTWLSPTFTRYGLYAISIIFALRSVGDFRYFGFFKKIKNTNFAKKDTVIYTPLVLIICLLEFLIVWL